MHNNGKVNTGTAFRPIYLIGGLLAHAKIDVPSEMLFGRYRKLRPEMSALLNGGRVLAHPVRVGRCCMGVLHVNTYIHAHAHAGIQRRTSIFSSLLVPLTSPSSVGTGFKEGRYYIWLPGTAHLVYAPCLTQQGRKRPSYSQKRFLAEDLVCCQYHSCEILPASDSLSRILDPF